MPRPPREDDDPCSDDDDPEPEPPWKNQERPEEPPREEEPPDDRQPSPRDARLARASRPTAKREAAIPRLLLVARRRLLKPFISGWRLRVRKQHTRNARGYN